MTYLVLTVAAGLNPYGTLYFYSNGVNDLWVWGGGIFRSLSFMYKFQNLLTDIWFWTFWKFPRAQ